MSLVPKWFKPEARREEETESNIVYISVDMIVKQGMDIAMAQINLFRDKNVRAWFVDIRHTPNQTPNALQLKEAIDIELRRASPKLKPINRTVCLNIGHNPYKLRARDKMYEILKDHRAKNVVFRGPNDEQQSIEY